MICEQWNMLSFEYGTVALVARADCLVRVCFECSPDDAVAAVKKFYPDAVQFPLPLLEDGLEQISEYFLGQRRLFSVPLVKQPCSSFASKVRQLLVDVPYGAVVTYGKLAAMAGSPKAARAVGTVMSSNPFPLIVPCHRVVNADGSIGQYSAAHGSKTKAWLLDFEREFAGKQSLSSSSF